MLDNIANAVFAVNRLDVVIHCFNLLNAGNIQSLERIDPILRITDGNNFVARLKQLQRDRAARIAKSLDGDGRLLGRSRKFAHHCLKHVKSPCPGGLVPTLTTWGRWVEGEG